MHEITRSDAGAENLSTTAKCISQIIEQAKTYKQKAICFITGVPGAGKTLAGLNIANERLKTDENEHAVFLSGNGPLVSVLREALTRNAAVNQNIKKSEAERHVKAFVQNIHHFRDEYLKNPSVPTEKVVVFDEAQRAWNQEQTSSFMQRKRGLLDFSQSEPHFLINVMDRHQDWCVIVCLIGGGQEINTGEAGLSEWVAALKNDYPKWQVYFSEQIIKEAHYLNNPELTDWLIGTGHEKTALHLATSVRSFRCEKLSEFVHALLDADIQAAQALYQQIKQDYPIVLTRDLQTAKQWLKQRAKGSERFGLIASSGGRRLKALGVNVKNEIDVNHWFLNTDDDVRSSYYLEDVATEFDVQGLELDWVCVGWDSNFYYDSTTQQWNYRAFKGSRWQNVCQASAQNYLKNAYRVLLTRARQGMVIWLPEGSDDDPTRAKCFYDDTYQFLVEAGLRELKH
ncbi:DUF2075 domain-containing protein [Neisseria animalis]|uniref:DUF2075 domain-containing protein n=1 Tax=Neisseria animalis TaxID=492 RepID=UPI000F6F0585|nr:DUF2075 domain-containing protein [Neisseria animalis]VEE08429.1 Uncharacterized conserved protein [Neisseria animalis]